MKTIARRLASEYPRTNGGLTATVTPIHEMSVGSIRPVLLVLFGAVACTLLIACANIANMLLARGVARTREVAMRMALGASRRRIVLQLLTESLLLAFLGAAAGVALAWKASAVLLSMATPGPNPVPLNLTPDMPVLGFTLDASRGLFWVAVAAAIAVGMLLLRKIGRTVSDERHRAIATLRQERT